eukprot:s2172_g6.t1
MPSSEAVVNGDPDLMVSDYEEGKEVALCQSLVPGVPEAALLEDGGSGCAEQSVHESAPKWARGNLSTSSQTAMAGTGRADSLALEPTAEAFVSANQKKDADQSVTGCTLGSCGSVLGARLLEVFPLRSKTMGEGNQKSIFPLPTSRAAFLQLDPDMNEKVVSWLFCVTISLNSSWGSEIFNEGFPNRSQRRSLEGILKEVRRFCGMETKVAEVSWKDFFKVRSIDYKGDEVKVARRFSWKNISPALPNEIGKVPLESVCTLGSRHYVLNFDQYLKPSAEWGAFKPPRVMVDDEHWGAVCEGLVQTGIGTFIQEHEVFHAHDAPLLNGLFGVSKEEWTADGDVNTLPSWSGMSPFFLQPTENLLVSSEDVKCFFYTMAVPEAWTKYLAFNKLVPDSALPSHLQGRRVYVAARVLPMGFLNSVSLAQHVHRNLALQSGGSSEDRECNAPERELRKDRSFPQGDSLWRIYLDNYDLLEKVEATQMVDLEGTTAPGVLALRGEYEVWQVPRNIKKSVERSSQCEVQGATVDGLLGVAYPREVKMAKYLGLALDLCSQRVATQKQWQVACGGLVYIAMFRRQLLGGLNSVWAHIESYNRGRFVQTTPAECKLEVLRFLGCLPLARLDFRLDIHEMVTCSDASTTGGGVCASKAVTPFGQMVAEGSLRGEMAEHTSDHMILTIGLFDGIGALRVALDALGAQVIGHVSVEKAAGARRVVEAHYPGVVTVTQVEDVTDEMVKEWSTLFSQTSLVLLGAGPPCQGVSGLNADRKGALKDSRSSLFTHVPRVRELLKRHFCWCPIFTLMESVASMDRKDRDTMSEAVGMSPLSCNAGNFTWCQRPRLYWVDWEVDDSCISFTEAGDGSPGVLWLEGSQDISEVTRQGWLKVEPAHAFPTFTTSRPQAKPGRKPAGIQHCSAEELQRWAQDLHRFPPYQYKRQHCLVNRENQLRVPDVGEREMMLGFPLHYTAACMPKGQQKGADYNDARLCLLGNTWSVPVVAWQLLGRLGIIPTPSPQQVLDSLKPGTSVSTQGRLVRLPLNPRKGATSQFGHLLASKLSNLVSMKGEDVLLSTPTSQMVRYHRLRASVPSSLWRWRIVTGWRWRCGKEHINSLELRAILTSLRWRPEDRARQRRKLGTLRQLTVQPATRKRYNNATDAFLRFLRDEQQTLPHNKAQMDSLVCDYLEHLWSSGAGRALACDTLAGLQDFQPNLRNHLPGAWRLLKAWHVNELPNRAPPLPEHVVQAMAGWAFFKGYVSFGISLIVGFYSMLRTGELLGLRSSHMVSSAAHTQVLISLGEEVQRFGLGNINLLTVFWSKVGPLEGVKSRSKVILRMNNVSFTYPTKDADKPTIMDVSLTVSQVSRVAVIGANGAGKSTAIKVLVGEQLPTEGTIWKAQGLRLAYVAQHAFHHLEKHMQDVNLDSTIILRV